MARVPKKVQFKRYQQVTEIYVADQGAFAYLDGAAQMDVYAFYQPHKDHLPDSLTEHQATVAAKDPSLPHRAGKAYKELVHIAAALARARARPQVAPVRGHVKGPRPKRNIVVRGVRRPEPDLHKIARVLLSLAEQQAKEAAANEGDVEARQ